MWFDVGIVRYTTPCDIRTLHTGLWFDVGHEDKNQQVIEHDQVDVINNIEPLIKVIRGHQVMLDRDLARLHGVETGQLNRQVKRGYKR